MRKCFGPALIFVFFLICLLGPAVQSAADDKHHRDGGHERILKRKGGESDGRRGGRDKGNETTGQMAGWLLAVANLSVALSVLVKGTNRFLPWSENRKKALVRFNQTQKKYLMKLHYFLNPVVAVIAFLHWSLSRCVSTSLPEWGLTLMIVMAGVGLLLKFRMAPRSLVKPLLRAHTNPAGLAALVCLLLIGHRIVD